MFILISVLFFGILIGVIVWNIYVYFFKPSLLDESIWTDEKRLENYFSKHYVDEKVAFDLIYMQNQAKYVPLFLIESSICFMILGIYIVSVGKFLDYSNFLIIFLSQFIGIGRLFTTYKKKEVISILDREKISNVFKKKEPLTPYVEMVNIKPVEKKYYNIIIVITIFGIILSLLTFKDFLIFIVLINLTSLGTLFFIDNQPFNYMFTNNEEKWLELSIKQKKIAILGAISIGLLYLIIIILCSFLINGVFK